MNLNPTIFAIFLGSGFLFEVSGHGLMLSPTPRSSLRRSKLFQEFLALGPDNTVDNAQNCGFRADGDGVGIMQEDDPGSNCGVCGDDLRFPKPRANEHDGKFDRKIITATYLSGDVIKVSSLITNPHWGTLEWRLCTNVSDETQKCFNKHVLKILEPGVVPVTPTKVKVPLGVRKNSDLYMVDYVKLPEGVTCERCVLQWNYRTGRENTGADGVKCGGCGAQETFRSCADIKIVPYVTLLKNLQTGTCLSRTAYNYFDLVTCDSKSTSQYIDLKQDLQMYQQRPFYITMYNDWHCFDVNKGEAWDGNNIIFYDCNSGDNQKWSFVYPNVNHGIFQIKSLSSSKCLNPTGKSGDTSIEIRTCNLASRSQFWQIIQEPIPARRN